MLFFSLLLAISSTTIIASPNPAYVQSFCAIALGLVEEAAFQIRLSDYLKSASCTSNVCTKTVDRFILTLESKIPPDDVCLQIGLSSNGKWNEKILNYVV